MRYTFETDTEEEARMLFNALDMCSALTEIAMIARNQIKHGVPQTAYETLERVRVVASDTLELVQ